MLPDSTPPRAWDHMSGRYPSQPTWGEAQRRLLRRSAGDRPTASSYKAQARKAERMRAVDEFRSAPAHLTLKLDDRPAASPLSETVATLKRQLGAYWAQAEVAALTQKVSDLRIAQTHLQKAHERLSTLARLDRDWDSYGGSPPTAMAISAAHGVLIAVLNELGDDCASSLSLWTTAPLHNGGIQFEWNGSEGLIEIEVSPSGELSYLLDRETGEIEESENGLDVPVDIVVRRIRSVLVR